MTEERRERMAIRLITAEREYRNGHKVDAFRIVILIVAELIGVLYRMENKEESK